MFNLKRLLFLGFFISSFVLLRGQNLSNFNHLSPTLDNTQIIVFKTAQDSFGNIWMINYNGVLIYDGYNYKLKTNKSIFPGIQKNDFIKDIIKDGNNNIWLLTHNGLLTKYDSKLGSFENLTSLAKGDHITAFIAKNKNVWLTSKKGNIFNYSNGKMKNIFSFTKMSPKVNNIIDIALTNLYLFVSTLDGKIYQYNFTTEEISELVGLYNDYPGTIFITTDQLNKLWIGTVTLGLFVYDINKKEFIEDALFKGVKYNINKELFLSLYNDSKGNIWGGTDGGGLYKINTLKGDIEIFIKNDANQFSLSSNTILGINEDSHNNLWISTNYGGLNILPSFVNNIKHHQGSGNGIPSRVLSIFKSSDNSLWVGTDGSGLTKITYNSNGSTNQTQFFNNINLTNGFYVQSITEDNRGNIWFGTYKNGLWVLDPKKETYEKVGDFNSKTQGGIDIRTVYKDSKGRIWASSDTSLNIYNSNKELLASFKNNNNGLNGGFAESIAEDKNGVIWLGLSENKSGIVWLSLKSGGLFQFEEDIVNIKNSSFINQTKSFKEIHSSRFISVADSGDIWLLNGFGRLFQYNPRTKTFKTFEHVKSVNGQFFLSVLVADNNNIWMSSYNGIHNLKLKEERLESYYYSDGFRDNLFLKRSAFKDSQGYLYFGGAKGFNYFNPKEIKKKESNAKLNINDIQILYQSAESLLGSQITTAIPNIKSLKLKNNQSSFSFRFSVIDNILNSNYYYAYRLKGFEDDWITSPSERTATFTNIPSGDYVFEVIAGTERGIWNVDTKSIAINIEKPFWNKPLAYILYLVIAILLASGLMRWYSLRSKLILGRLVRKNENEIHSLKMNFFAKMSHEIQTPITLILGPIENMIRLAEENGNLLLKQRLRIISNNSKRLSTIARELTLVRNKELRTLKLSVTKNNLYRHIEDITLSFRELARNKRIDFAINCPENLNNIWYDKEKIEHILYNLLSNAFKFTPKEGYLQLNVAPTNSKNTIKISVTDSGPGISENELKVIFELFYQSNIGKRKKGSGIGLALTKDLIDLHKGKIEVNSVPNEGTVFTITFSVSEDAYTESERITTDELEEENLSPQIEKENLNIEENPNPNKETVLIVEDNYDLQNFLKEILTHHYNIIVAENGEEGYYYAKNNFPDLILSDIMMPILDGIEMCKKLHENSLTKHIPVILLTAKNTTNSKIEGLKSGAIEYISKPFNTNELLLKVKNIITSKEHIISKYRKETINRPEILIEKSQDEIFLENFVSQVNLRLDDSSFKMEELATSLHMSYSSLYRKCQSLTGQSLVDFVRLIRLKKAAILLTKYGYNISETSYKTGFNDPKYFSKCFKKQFSKTPGKFKKDALKEDINEYLKKYSINDMDLETL